MIATEEGDAFWILDLEAEEILESFDGVIASVDEISDEDVASFIDLSTWVSRRVPVLKS